MGGKVDRDEITLRWDRTPVGVSHPQKTEQVAQRVLFPTV